MQAGIEVLMFALRKLVQISTKPDLVILNMGIWVRDWTATGQDYKERFETVLQHGNYFNDKTGACHNLGVAVHTHQGFMLGLADGDEGEGSFRSYVLPDHSGIRNETAAMSRLINC